MPEEVEDILVPLLGALQAAVGVLLTISTGIIAAQFGLLGDKSTKELSKVCVDLFLPALLIKNVGSQIPLHTAIDYVPTIIWAIVYNVVSIVFGLAVTRVFNMPDWVTPAIAFNNTTSLPLLLVQSLEATGILNSIDSSADAVDRAKSFFLMNSMIGNSLTFALGPKLLHGHNEDAPVAEHKSDQSRTDAEANGDLEATREEEQEEREAERINEETSLLPNRIVKPATKMYFTTSHRAQEIWNNLPRWLRSTLIFLRSFANPPTIGTVIGVIIGIVPPLHRLFFNSQENGGYLTGWLTSALSNVGELFAALQAIVVGVKLASSILKMKKGEASGNVPWRATALVLGTRFVLWPVVSIGVIYLLAMKTSVLGADPLILFCMMLMPTGPPALKLTALAEVNDAPEEEKMTIAKFLMISYAISPIICFTVVGALKASQAAA